MIDVILASRSPRRRVLLSYIFPEFRVVIPNVKEPMPAGEPPERFVRDVALMKLRAVSEGDIVIAADTVVVLGGKILGKPRDASDALAMLKTLTGKCHRVYTGCAFRVFGEVESFFTVTTVCFRHMDDLFLKAYVDTGIPLDKAGAYGIQDPFGAILVERLEGDYYTVMGLPVGELFIRLRSHLPGLLPKGHKQHE